MFLAVMLTQWTSIEMEVEHTSLKLGYFDELAAAQAKIARLRSALQEIIKDISWAEQIAKRALSDDKAVLETFYAWRLRAPGAKQVL